MKKESFIVVDIETTGLSRKKHKITEIAALRVRNNKILNKFHSLVNPEVQIPKFITKLTGIDNELVKDAPLINKVIPKFNKFINKDVFVAHNASFDYNFLNHNTSLHLKKEMYNPKLCTRKLANRLLTHLPSKKLSSLCEHYNLENKTAHRAMSDALVTKEILNNFFTDLEKREITTTSQLLKFQDSKIIHT